MERFPILLRAIFPFLMSLLDVSDVYLSELCQGERERCLLERVVELKEMEECIQVHGQLSRQVLDQLVSVSHVDEVDTFRRRNRLWVWLVQLLLL